MEENLDKLDCWDTVINRHIERDKENIYTSEWDRERKSERLWER